MRLGVVLVLTVILVACGEGADPTDDPTTTPSSATGDKSVSLPPADHAVVEAAKADLADHLSVPMAEIALVSFQRVTWNDGSLGCPQPGMVYTQALVDGSKTVLEVDGVSYAYHAGQDDVPFLCENPVLKPGPDPSVTIPRNDT